MLKGSAIWVLGAAGLASLAIGVGVFTNHRDELIPLAPMFSEHVETADVDPSRVGWTEPRIIHADNHSGQVVEEQAAPVEVESLEQLAAAADESSDLEDGAGREVDPFVAALDAFAVRDYASVIELLENVTEADDPRFDVHYLLGLALRYEGRAAESAARLDAALRIRPQSARALINSARALLVTRDLAQAEERVRLAIELSPDNAGAWNVLGRVHLTNGALPEAEDAFARVLEIDPEHAWALNNLGFARLQRGAWDAAAEVLQLAVLAESDVATFHNNLGIAYERLSRLSDAQREYAQALTLQPGYGKAEVSLARVTERIVEGGADVAARDVAAGDATATIATRATPSAADAASESSVQP